MRRSTRRAGTTGTGGGPGEPLDKLSDKVVALVGTGASGLQCVPDLVASAKHVYVFQRTPSAIGERGNRETAPDFDEEFEPGWQKSRMDNFQALMMGLQEDVDLVDDGWTHDYAAVRPPMPEGMTLREYSRWSEEIDFKIMEAHRERIDGIVTDAATAEILKPYYRYICKRPCFHDEYLPAFNNPNITLIDCPGGIERITDRGLTVDGKQFEVDCIVYGTGSTRSALPWRVGGAPTSSGVGASRWPRNGPTVQPACTG